MFDSIGKRVIIFFFVSEFITLFFVKNRYIYQYPSLYETFSNLASGVTFQKEIVFYAALKKIK